MTSALLSPLDLLPPKNPPKWITDGCLDLQIPDSKGTILCEPYTVRKDDSPYNAMWINGEGITSGEHFWTITFGNFTKNISACVGLSNKSRFKKQNECEGLFYGLDGVVLASVSLNPKSTAKGQGTLPSAEVGQGQGSPAIVGQEKQLENNRYGPCISSKNTVGILVSFTKGSDPELRLQVYFFHNEKPLGMAFDIPASALPNAYPVIRFYGNKGKGSAFIRKLDEVPLSNLRAPNLSKVYVDIGGAWRMMSGTFVTRGEARMWNEYLDQVTMKIVPCGDLFRVHLDVDAGTEIKFKIRRTLKGWKAIEEFDTDDLKLKGIKGNVQRAIVAMCQYPKRVFLNGNQLELNSGKVAMATFGAFDDDQKPFYGNPFRVCEKHF